MNIKYENKEVTDMKMTNKSFLLGRAHHVGTISNMPCHYDNEMQINTVIVDGKTTPLCGISSMITGSKTESAPGDDDPDPDTELMY